MSAYSGRYYPGAAKDRKIEKREEAEARQAARRERAAEALKAFAESERAAG